MRGAVSPDHIHLLLAAPPILTPAKLAQYIKGRSSRLLQAEFPELRKQYWGQHMWARAYFCATGGAVDEATIKAYIENQRWDEADESFKIRAHQALSRVSAGHLQAASAAMRLFSAIGFYRLSAGSPQQAAK